MAVILRTSLVAGVTLGFVVCGSAPTTAQEESSSRSSEEYAVEIQVSSAVGRVQLVSGRLKSRGRPVVLVRSDLPDEPWWVQGQPTPIGKDGFSAKAIFGNSKSPRNARFRVVTILVDPGTASTEYRTGQILRELPDLPRSRELLVTLGRTGRPVVALAPTRKDKQQNADEADAEPVKEKPPIEITSPKTGDSVQQVADLSGRIDAGFTPVILVRPLAKDSVWWIQKPVKRDVKGRFSAKVVVGSRRTAEGTRFRIVALAVADNSSRKDSSLDEFKAGEFLKELPKDLAASEELVLTLRRTEPTEEESESRNQE